MNASTARCGSIGGSTCRSRGAATTQGRGPHWLTVALGIAWASASMFTPAETMAQAASPVPPTAVAVPGGCTTPPLTRQEVEARLAQVPPADVAAVMTEAELPSGMPVNRETEAVVIDVEQQLLACGGREDRPRLAALMTGNALQALLYDTQQSPADLFQASPTATDEGPGSLTVARVRDARTLADGRIGAVVTWDDSETPGLAMEQMFHIFTRVDGKLLLDEEILIVP